MQYEAKHIHFKRQPKMLGTSERLVKLWRVDTSGECGITWTLLKRATVSGRDHPYCKCNNGDVLVIIELIGSNKLFFYPVLATLVHGANAFRKAFLTIQKSEFLQVISVFINILILINANSCKSWSLNEDFVSSRWTAHTQYLYYLLFFVRLSKLEINSICHKEIATMVLAVPLRMTSQYLQNWSILWL